MGCTCWVIVSCVGVGLLVFALVFVVVLLFVVVLVCAS